jgi:aryl-alcohol dehydrogenase
VRITAAISRDAPAPLIEEADLDEPRADEVLVRIVAVGICHTDLRAHQGGILPTPKPVVLGHEGAGIVEKVGASVTHLKPGDHVVLSGSSCGRCESCLDHHPSYCREGMARCFGGQRVDGSSALSQQGAKLHGHFFGQSSFATHCVADARGAVRIDPDIPLDIAAPLACAGITGAGAVLNSFALKPGQSIAVFGAGGVGSSAVMAAAIAGAKHIIAIDPNPQRRDLALSLGATAAIDSQVENVAAAVRDVAPAGVNFAFITAGVASVFDAAIASLAPRGVAGFVASPRQPWTGHLMSLLAGGKSLRGIQGGDSDPQATIPLLLDHWRQGRFPMEKLITHYEFSNIGAAFGDFLAGTVIKPVVRMPGPESQPSALRA